MTKRASQGPQSTSENFDVSGSSREQNNGGPQGATGSETKSGPFICYGARTDQPSPGRESKHRKQYRVGGNKRITVAQNSLLALVMQFAMNCSRSPRPLNDLCEALLKQMSSVSGEAAKAWLLSVIRPSATATDIVPCMRLTPLNVEVPAA